MKFGVLVHKTTMNLGDDIQSYAAARFLPQVDYMIDREALDSFVSDDGKPVGLIMSAWYMWKKWNWPPSEYINPLMIGFHHFERLNMTRSLPNYHEHLQGIGGQWMKDYAPIGCRDNATVELLTKLGIDSYFSGCITLTLNKQPDTADKGQYVILVDVAQEVEQLVRKQLEGTNITVKKLSHQCDYRFSTDSWETRSAVVEERLTVYQNARCILTGRLHVALPCLAMQVPVLMIKEHSVEESKQFDPARFNPYFEWLNVCSESEFVQGKYDYDVQNPKANPTVYLETRNKLINQIEQFVSENKDCDATVEQLNKATFTLEEKHTWQIEFMKNTCDKVIAENKEIIGESSYITRAAKKSIDLANQGLQVIAKNGDQVETIKQVNNILTLIKDNYDDTRRGFDIKELGYLGLVKRKLKRMMAR